PEEGYRWEVVVGEGGGPALGFCMEEAGQRMGNEDSDVQSWSLLQANGDTPSPAPPLCLLFPIKGRSAVLGHVLVQRPRFCPLPAAVQRYLTLLTTHAGLVWDNFQLVTLRLAQKEIQHAL